MNPTADTSKRYFWLKLKDDFFRQKEIKQLRRIAGGDTFTIIYLKMLLRSLKDNGKLYYEGIDEDFVSELALDIDEDVENVKITVSFLMNKGILIQCSDAEYELLSAGGITGSEGYSAQRMRRLREKKLLASQCDAPVTAGDEEIEIDIEKEIDIDIDHRKKKPAVNLAGFNEFWALYPRKVAKTTASSSWKKLKPNEDTLQCILTDIERRLNGEWRGKDMTYIPYPSTYLNQRRWEDETEVNELAKPARPVEEELDADQLRALEEVRRQGIIYG